MAKEVMVTFNLFYTRHQFGFFFFDKLKYSLVLNRHVDYRKLLACHKSKPQSNNKQNYCTDYSSPIS